jgi:hypothetical protein
MRTLVSWRVVLLLAALVHLDWHVARPTHHRLSLGWSQHWLLAIAGFALAGVYIARRWPKAPWKAAAVNVGLALLVGHIIEPVLEAAYYGGELAYPVGPERWSAFGAFVAAGLPALAAAVWWQTRRAAGERPDTLAAGKD